MSKSLFDGSGSRETDLSGQNSAGKQRRAPPGIYPELEDTPVNRGLLKGFEAIGQPYPDPPSWWKPAIPEAPPSEPQSEAYRETPDGKGSSNPIVELVMKEALRMQKRKTEPPPFPASPSQLLSPAPSPSPVPSFFPYPLQGEGLKLLSDPIEKNIRIAFRNKQPVELFPEREIVQNAGHLTRAAGRAYTEDNYIQATDAIHQGSTQNPGMAYSYPANYKDIAPALGHGDSYGEESTMAHPDSDVWKGFQRVLRGIKVSAHEVQQMGNKRIDPKGEYLDHRMLEQWIAAERAWLKKNGVPELIDFTRLDWQKNPDKVIELAGKYFRESLLGSHLFGYATEVMKGRVAGPIGNQIIGILTGIARIYAQKDDLADAALRGTTSASASGNWDALIHAASERLPIVSRQAVRLLNHLMTKPIKERIFEIVTGDVRTGKRGGREGGPKANPNRF